MYQYIQNITIPIYNQLNMFLMSYFILFLVLNLRNPLFINS